MGEFSLKTPKQLSLDVQLHDEATFDNYFVGENGALVNCLKDITASQTGERVIYLSGPKSSGRTHLLQAACHELAKKQQPVCYIPLRAQLEIKPEMLDGLTHMPLICVDDLECVAGDDAWELALFNVLILDVF